MECQSFVGNHFCRRRTKSGYLDVALFELGEVLFESFYARRTEENEHVVVEILDLFRRQVVAHGAEHHAFRVCQLL